MVKAEYYMFPVEDNSFNPDTEQKCHLLFQRLGELAADIHLDYPDKTVWVVWEANND